MFKGERHLIRLGHEEEGWTAARAERERHRIAEAIRAGVWQPPQASTDPPPSESRASDCCPTVLEVARVLVRRKQLTLADNTISDLKWRLECHLLPYFGELPVSAANDEAVFGYIEYQLKARAKILTALEVGRPLVDARGVKAKPLSNTSINATLATLAALLDEPECQRWLPKNPARGKGKRLKVTKRKGNFLEADELQSLLQAAERLDRAVGPAETRAARARELRAGGATLKEISDELGVGLSTVHYYVASRRTPEPNPPLLRLGIVAILGLAGPRVTEAAKARRADVDLQRRQMSIHDSKTETGVRVIHLSPNVASILDRVFSSIGQGPKAPAFPTETGSHRNKDNIRHLLARVVHEADRARGADGLPPLPDNVTPHTLRRTYITLLLEAHAPLPYVMAQVGHKDEKTVLGLYARVLHRQNRDAIGEALDGLLSS